jgi:hypothetical protein
LANKTYTELIVEAIESHPQKRLTLTQIYEWMIDNVPACRQNAVQPSSTGWKNCIRHNLSLHKVFQRIPIDTKNSFWFVNDEELERKRRSKHTAAGRRRGRCFTTSPQLQGCKKQIGNHTDFLNSLWKARYWPKYYRETLGYMCFSKYMYSDLGFQGEFEKSFIVSNQLLRLFGYHSLIFYYTFSENIQKSDFLQKFGWA